MDTTIKTFIPRSEAAESLKTLKFESDELRAACMAGVRLATYIFGEAPAAETLFMALTNESDLKKQLAIIETFVSNRRAAEDDAEIHAANKMFAELEESPDAKLAAIAAIRGLVLGGEYVDERGRRCSADGKPAEDDSYRPISGTIAAPPKSETTVTMPDSTTFTINRDTKAKVAAAVLIDMEQNPGTVPRYISEIGRDETGKEIGTACFMRATIVKAAETSRYPELSGSCDKLRRMAKIGNIQNSTHRMIGAMETVRMLKEDELQNADIERIDDYINWMKLFCITDNTQQEFNIPSSALTSYRDEKGSPLNGIDDSGNLVSGNANTVKFMRKYLRTLAKDVGKKMMSALVINNLKPFEREKELMDAYRNTQD